MKHTLIIRAAARADMKEARAWYRAKDKVLAKRFIQALDDTLATIRTTPLMHATDFMDARRAHLRGFPYFVVYAVETKRVIVLGVFHERRDPSLWQRRVEQSANGDE